MNLTMAFVLLALSYLSACVALYYALPPAGPGVTHYLDGTGTMRRTTWARIAAPFYTTGETIVHHSPLPLKRI